MLNERASRQRALDPRTSFIVQAPAGSSAQTKVCATLIKQQSGGTDFGPCSAGVRGRTERRIEEISDAG